MSIDIRKYHVRVRRHNGQCAFGPWLWDDQIPYWIREAIFDETDFDGSVQVNGDTWVYVIGGAYE